MLKTVLDYDNRSTINEREMYLLQTNRIKLQDYIQCGLIAPDRYLGDECEIDVQSKNSDVLVVSDGYIDELNEEQILIELILTEDEKFSISKTENICYFDFPLPITRIKKVYTQSRDISKWIIKNIKNSEKGFLPDRLFDVFKKRNKIIFDKREYSNIEINQNKMDYSKQIRYFDKRLGIFSFVKNINMYYVDHNDYIANYSDNYFSMLSTFFEEKIVDGSFNGLDVLNENGKFKEILYSSNQIDKDLIQTILEDIEDLDIKEIFGQLLMPNSVRKTLLLLLEKEQYLYYYIGLVYYFRQKNSNRKDSFKQDIESLIPYKLAEVSLSILGIYIGYTNLRASEQITLNDSNFKKIFGNSSNIKFKLDSKLDYIVIETIYRYCFDQNFKAKNGNEFNYLIYPAKQKFLKLPINKNFKEWYEVTQFEYFEAQYLKIKKHSFNEIVLIKLNKYKDEIVFPKHYLINFISKYFKDLILYTKDGKLTEPYCKKNSFEEAILQDTSHQNELFKAFDMDGK